MPGAEHALREAAEDRLDDAAARTALAAHDASDDGTRIPAEVVDRLLAGENPWRVFRENRGLTQAEAAALVAAEQSTISALERGARHAHRLRPKIAAAYGVAPDEIEAWLQQPAA